MSCEMLAKLGIVNKGTKTYKYFNKYISPDFTSLPKMKPSEYVSFCWSEYQKHYKKDTGKNPDGSLNGYMLEAIIKTELFREGILPFYLQTSLTYVPNVAFDILLYNTKDEITALSLKTSFRERYKQADLEGMALRNVHRTAKHYLITLNKQEAQTVKNKIKNQVVMFINGVFVATESEFDDFIEVLKKDTYKEAGTVPVIASNIIIK